MSQSALLLGGDKEPGRRKDSFRQVNSHLIVLPGELVIALGVVFGVYPAVRATSLDPVLALHYE